MGVGMPPTEGGGHARSASVMDLILVTKFCDFALQALCKTDVRCVATIVNNFEPGIGNFIFKKLALARVNYQIG